MREILLISVIHYIGYKIKSIDPDSWHQFVSAPVVILRRVPLVVLRLRIQDFTSLDDHVCIHDVQTCEKTR